MFVRRNVQINNSRNKWVNYSKAVAVENAGLDSVEELVLAKKRFLVAPKVDAS